MNQCHLRLLGRLKAPMNGNPIWLCSICIMSKKIEHPPNGVFLETHIPRPHNKIQQHYETYAIERNSLLRWRRPVVGFSNPVKLK